MTVLMASLFQVPENMSSLRCYLANELIGKVK